MFVTQEKIWIILFQIYSNYLEIAESDVLSLLYSPNFAASILDIFASILNVATLKMYNIRKFGTQNLLHWLEHNRISVLHTVPSIFRFILKNIEENQTFSTIRVVDLGGEAVYKSDIELIKKYFSSNCRVFNHLAATEAHVIAFHQINPEGNYNHPILPVGRAARGLHLRSSKMKEIQ